MSAEAHVISQSSGKTVVRVVWEPSKKGVVPPDWYDVDLGGYVQDDLYQAVPGVSGLVLYLLLLHPYMCACVLTVHACGCGCGCIHMACVYVCFFCLIIQNVTELIVTINQTLSPWNGAYFKVVMHTVSE